MKLPFFLIVTDQICKFWFMMMGIAHINREARSGEVFWWLIGIYMLVLLHREVKEKRLWYFLIISGGISSLIDGFLWGAGIDYINMGVAIANLSDMYLFAGISLFGVGYAKEINARRRQMDI